MLTSIKRIFNYIDAHIRFHFFFKTFFKWIIEVPRDPKRPECYGDIMEFIEKYIAGKNDLFHYSHHGYTPQGSIHQYYHIKLDDSVEGKSKHCSDWYCIIKSNNYRRIKEFARQFISTDKKTLIIMKSYLYTFLKRKYFEIRFDESTYNYAISSMALYYDKCHQIKNVRRKSTLEYYFLYLYFFFYTFISVIF